LAKLTARQRAFAREFLVDHNATQAAIRAGYSPKSAADIGYENLAKPDIVEAMTALVADNSKSAKRAGVDSQWVLTNLVDAHDKAKAKDTAAHISNRLKALELIGRHVDVRAFRAGLGFAGPDNDDTLQIWDLSKLNDEEFDELGRLLSKISVTRALAAGTGSPAEAQG
jgi:phage terminase small subunit